MIAIVEPPGEEGASPRWRARPIGRVAPESSWPQSALRERRRPSCLIGDGELALMDPMGELDTGQSRWPHRGVSVVQPIYCAIDCIVHRGRYSCTCSWKSHTARSRTSAGYLVDALPIARSSQEMEPPGSPARFTAAAVEPNDPQARLQARQFAAVLQALKASNTAWRLLG